MTEYNGWTNYETWLVKLWMDNEEGSYLYWQEQARCVVVLGDAAIHRAESDAYELAMSLKDHHEEAVEELAAEGFISDLLNAAMSEVNWQEIATSLIGDMVAEAEFKRG